MKKSKAQGILEVMIAIYISVVGILSIMNLVFSTIKVQRFNHNMLIATNLAREGVEIVRNIRDSNWVEGGKWDIGLKPGDLDTGVRSFVIDNWYVKDQSGYSLKYIGEPWEDCQEVDSPCRLKLVKLTGPDESRKIYTESSYFTSGYTSSDTNFYRIIYIDEICYNDSMLELDDRETINNVSDIICSESPINTETIGFRISVMVGWRDGDTMRTTTVKERIYNWK
jgi:hypothetical protein